MSIHPLSGKEILFTRQRHEAKKMGLHWDYRLVLGDKAYSWATKKEMPEQGKAIILFEQPVHDREYALSKEVEIPDGNYGAGKTYLDWVRKAKIEKETEPNKLVILSGADRFLLKKLDPMKYGEKAWLFKNLGLQKQASINKYLTKIAIRLNLYESVDGKKKWVQEGKTPPRDTKLIKSYYKKHREQISNKNSKTKSSPKSKPR